MKIIPVAYDIFDLLVVGGTLKLDLQMIEGQWEIERLGFGGTHLGPIGFIPSFSMRVEFVEG